MSEQLNEPLSSPDYLEISTEGKGTKKLNNLPKIALMSLVGGSALVFVYAMSTNELNWNRETKAEEVPANLRPAEPPIKKPPGPDVHIDPAVMMPPPEVQQAQMIEDEAVKQARAKKQAELDAATKAPSRVSLNRTRPMSNNQEINQTQDSPRADRVALMPPPPPGYGGEGGEPQADPAEQAQKRAFLAAVDPNASPYLKHAKNPPISPYEIKAGDVIPGVMITGANSELPGQITGQVKSDVYDSSTGNHLLIPATSRVVGTYDSAINGGQERIFVAWQRIIFPDGSSIALDSMPGADQSGLAGFKDQVDNHYVRTFGQAFLLSLFSAGIQLSQPRGAVQGTYNAQQIGAAQIGMQLGQLGMQLARRNLYMQPTLEIRPGFEFTIAVNKDMVIPPWRDGRMAQARSE